MYGMHTQMHLMTPQGHLVHLAMVYGQSSHLCGKIIKKFQLISNSFYLTTLGLLDTTSQRKLAHIQRLILLNCHFKFYYRYTCHHLSLGNMRPVSTTVPKVILLLFLYFSRTQLLACSLEKYLHLVLAPRSTTIQLTHGCERQLWQVEPHCDGRKV